MTHETPSIPDNRLYIGDCLPVLAEMSAAYGEFADLVYLDPPFNSARLYNHAFKGAKRTMPQKVAFADTWKWTDETKRDFSEFTEKESPGAPAAEFLTAMRVLLEKRDPSTLAYLTYMTRRVARIRAVMKPTASVYLHCDPTASHYLKLAMDALFGRGNFRNEIVWTYRKWTNTANYFQRNHDVVLFYARGKDAVFNKPLGEITRRMREIREQGYNDGSAHGKKILRVYDRDNPKARKKIQQGEYDEIYYLDDPASGAPVPDHWDIPILNPRSKERLGYTTQKPIALLKRVVEASSNPGGLVLDPFCGCGTTIAACHELGRRFIGIDIARSAAQVIARRMQAHYPGFGKLTVGDKTPTNVRGWGKLLPKDKGREEAPEWARFQYDAIALIPKAEQIEGEIQRTAKGGGDGGVDGLIHLVRPKTKIRSSIVIQVKRKRTPSMSDVTDSLAAVDRTGAFMGLLITLNPPTAGMREAAGGIRKQFNGKHYPKVAILTYDEVKAGKYAEAVPYEYAVDPEGGRQTGLDLSESAL